MEKEGYGLCDSIYYVKNEGEGLNGLELVDNNIKVEEMLRKYERSRKLVLTVMRDKAKQAIVLSPVKSKKGKEKLYARSYPSHIAVDLDEEEHCDNNMLQTQNSGNFQPLCTQIDENMQKSAEEGEDTEEEADAEQEEDAEEEGDADEDDSWMHPSKYDSVQTEKLRRKEVDEMQKRIGKRKRRVDEDLYEDESEPEDIFDSYILEEPVKKIVNRQGPTTRSHTHAEVAVMTDWAPSDDEEEFGFLGQEDDDGFEPLPFVLPNGRKSRAKKQTERVWYDETRENPEQQFRLKLCFKDVYQFRQALCRLHIVQVRNFHYHGNCPDRIIMWCRPDKKENYNC